MVFTELIEQYFLTDSWYKSTST